MQMRCFIFEFLMACICQSVDIFLTPISPLPGTAFVRFTAADVSVFPSPCRAPLAVWSPGNKPRSRAEAVFTARCKKKKKKHSGIIKLQMPPVKPARFLPSSLVTFAKLYRLWIGRQKMRRYHENNRMTRWRQIFRPSALIAAFKRVQERVWPATSATQTCLFFFFLLPSSLLKEKIKS